MTIQVKAAKNLDIPSAESKTTCSLEADFPVIATLPGLEWQILDTLQGWVFRFPDGRFDWPTPRERQIMEAFVSLVEGK